MRDRTALGSNQFRKTYKIFYGKQTDKKYRQTNKRFPMQLTTPPKYLEKPGLST